MTELIRARVRDDSERPYRRNQQSEGRICYRKRLVEKQSGNGTDDLRGKIRVGHCRCVFAVEK